jgi:hypothetical protein
MNNWGAVLCNSIKRGNGPLWNIGDRIRSTWRRSTRAVGGYWIGTCEYQGTRDDLLEMYLDGMMREIRESAGGSITWQGYIAEMRLTLEGVTYVRSMVDMANAVKVLYTRIGDTLLSNGGAESAAWSVATGKGGITGSATVTQDTTWVNTGTYSCKIVSAGGIRGANIEGAAGATYPITIVANTAYDITGVIKVDSGSWRISCNRSDTDASLAHDSSRGATGERTIKMTIPATNTYAGTVDLRITSEAAAGTCYGDTFYFGLSPYQAQTGWVTDTNSMLEYGRVELSSLEVAMSSAAANAKAATICKKQAWPKSLPPEEFTLVGNELLGETGDKLELTVHGYVHTLGNKYSLTTGTAAASVQVKGIITNEAEFVLPGSISSNTLSNLIDTRGPIKHWQVLMDIINAGDASGNRWVGGVSAGRYLDYMRADNVIAYHYRGGKFWNSAGGELEPWFAEPGHLLYLDDAPVGPTQISGNVEDDPHVVFVNEIEMGPPTDLYPQGTLTMRHEAQVI